MINLLQDLKERLGVAYLFISHNLAVVRHLSDRVVVMYLGRVVEQGAAHDVFARPLHPYSRGLLASVLRPDADAPARLAEVTSCSTATFRASTPCPTAAGSTHVAPTPPTSARPRSPRSSRSGGDHAHDHRVACHHWDELRPVPVRRVRGHVTIEEEADERSRSESPPPRRRRPPDRSSTPSGSAPCCTRRARRGVTVAPARWGRSASRSTRHSPTSTTIAVAARDLAGRRAVKVTLILRDDVTDMAAVNEAYEAHFPDGLPARTSFFVSRLKNPDMLVEIEAVIDAS